MAKVAFVCAWIYKCSTTKSYKSGGSRILHKTSLSLVFTPQNTERDFKTLCPFFVPVLFCQNEIVKTASGVFNGPFTDLHALLSM